MIVDLLFYMFASVMCIGALGVALSRNPMYSVLFLVLTFFTTCVKGKIRVMKV